MQPPFTVLHVCMGNICRSPMAERLLVHALSGLPGEPAELVHVHSAGTGGWHAGEEMNPPAAREVTRRGADAGGFLARKLRGEHLDGSDLILTATAEQQQYVLALRADAAGRTFVLGEFARLLDGTDLAGLPAFAPEPDAAYRRGVALVEAVDTARAGRTSQPQDDLDDPWGRGDAFFNRVGDEIDRAVRSFASALLDR